MATSLWWTTLSGWTKVTKTYFSTVAASMISLEFHVKQIYTSKHFIVWKKHTPAVEELWGNLRGYGWWWAICFHIIAGIRLNSTFLLGCLNNKKRDYLSVYDDRDREDIFIYIIHIYSISITNAVLVTTIYSWTDNRVHSFFVENIY